MLPCRKLCGRNTKESKIPPSIKSNIRPASSLCTEDTGNTCKQSARDRHQQHLDFMLFRLAKHCLKKRAQEPGIN